MIAVIFEVEPSESGLATYLALAAQLKEDLMSVDGFLSVERFESLSSPGKLLSLSFWRDEASVARWRNHEPHRQAQQTGRQGTFASYRLRVASVLRDYGLDERLQAPVDSLTWHLQ